MFLAHYLSVPSRPPENVTGNNLTSTSIVIRWSPISRRYVHGVLQGYKVSYVTADASSNRSWSEAVVNQSATSAVIANLRKFTVYMVSVEGFTSKGSGIESKCVAVTTDEDSKMITVLSRIQPSKFYQACHGHFHRTVYFYTIFSCEIGYSNSK